MFSGSISRFRASSIEVVDDTLARKRLSSFTVLPVLYTTLNVKKLKNMPKHKHLQQLPQTILSEKAAERVHFQKNIMKATSPTRLVCACIIIACMLIHLWSAEYAVLKAQSVQQSSVVPPPVSATVADLHLRYRIAPNQVYAVVGGYECKLDVYALRDASKLNPTVIMIHGGGWMSGTKEVTQMHIMPWLEMGYSVVNVGYRLGNVALAPAAVEDVRCALRWVYRNAKQYGFDTTAIIATGHSAGGHLALMTALLPNGGEFDKLCALDSDPMLRVAAVVNWFGITDVADQIEGGANKRDYATRWFGAQQMTPQGIELARKVSPLTYVRKGLPPVLTIHGDADATVPYSHAVRLHEALTKAGVPNLLHTVPKGGHGGFKREESVEIYKVIREFLLKHGLLRTQY
jgi:acetyl esterase/lipase